MSKRIYVVTETIGNNERLLKRFNEEEKEKALSFGEEYFDKHESTGIITLLKVGIDDKGNIINSTRRIYEVWD